MSIGTIGTVVGAAGAVAGAASSGKGGDEGGGGQLGGYGVYDPLGADRKVYLNKLASFMAKPDRFFKKNKVYKARVRQGLRAAESSGASRGLLDSGAIGVEMMQAGQDIASEEYDKEFQRLSLLAGANFAPQVYGAGQQGAGGSPGDDLAGGIGGLFQGADKLYDLWNKQGEGGEGVNNPTYNPGKGQPPYREIAPTGPVF